MPEATPATGESGPAAEAGAAPTARHPVPWLRVLVTLAGVGAVFYGAFQPAVDVRLYGAISFVEVGGVPGKLMLGFATLVLLAAVLRSTRAKLIACVAMWAALLWPLLEGLLTQDPEEARGLLHLPGRVIGGVVRTVGDTAKGLLSRALVTWTDGVAWMVAGCALVTVATLWALGADWRRRRRARNDG